MVLQIPSVPSADAMAYQGIFKSQYKTSSWEFYKVDPNSFSSSAFGFLAPLQLLLRQLLPLEDPFRISGKPFSSVSPPLGYNLTCFSFLLMDSTTHLQCLPGFRQAFQLTKSPSISHTSLSLFKTLQPSLLRHTVVHAGFLIPFLGVSVAL